MVKSCLLPEASLHGASARPSGWLGDARPPKDFFLLRNFLLFSPRPPTQIIASLTVLPYSAGDSECGRDYDTPL
jgi:hypothetical protein